MLDAPGFCAVTLIVTDGSVVEPGGVAAQEKEQEVTLTSVLVSLALPEAI